MTRTTDGSSVVPVISTSFETENDDSDHDHDTRNPRHNRRRTLRNQLDDDSDRDNSRPLTRRYRLRPQPTDDDSDTDEDNNEHRTTGLQSFMHLLKGYVGPGCLSLPWAFSQLGVVSGTIACFALAYWSSYNCWSVVQLKRLFHQSRQEQRATMSPVPGYQATRPGRLSISASNDINDEDDEDPSKKIITYPDVSNWLYGRKMKTFTTLCICVQQLAICTVFFSFVGTNLQAVLVSTFGLDELSHAAVITLCLPAVTGLVFLPNLKALAPVTIMATALLLLGLSLLAVVIGLEWPHRPTGQVPAVVDWKQVPLALCAILYSYEGICLILPIESAMQRPKNFFSIFSVAMISSATIFAIVAVSCVEAFGEVTNGSITAFLLEKYANDGSGGSADLKAWLLAANAAVSLSVLLTYPLQLFPALELLGPLLSNTPIGGSAPDTGRLRRRRRRRSRHTRIIRGSPSDAALGDFRSVPVNDESIVPGETAMNQGQSKSASASDADPSIAPNSALSAAGRQTLDEEPEDDNERDGDEEDGVFVDDSMDPIARVPVEDDDDEMSSPKTRVSLVLLTYVIAVAVPNVQVLISLAGALAGSSTALLIPPLLELAWLKQNDITGWKVSRCYILMTAGFVFLCIGTFAALADIVRAYARGG